MYVCMYVYICMYIYIYIYIYTHTHTFTHTSLTNTHAHTCVYVRGAAVEFFYSDPSINYKMNAKSIGDFFYFSL